tara:strand:- start:257 stop:1285 length:1029 start_codon:yes stop_codon:yes gene_type:complete
MEKSKSVSIQTGWKPLYFSLFENKRLVSCAACFIKTHSQGEYVFDHAWANAYSKLGLNYYPKLLIASPFTPVSGLRILLDPDSDSNNKNLIIKEIIYYCKENNISSLHINFFDKKELNYFNKHDFLIRVGEQFHFKNNNYNSFEEFLSSLSYKKRKSIIKERKSIKENQNLRIEVIDGKNIDKVVCMKMYQFYISTIKKKWSYNYLTEDFFLEIPKYLDGNAVIILASENNKVIAGALNFLSNNTLYGRYWGAEKEIQNLHFEVCFYQAIDFAIKNKLSKVEAGAQGLHKVKRGYLPYKTYSAHMLFNERLSLAVKNFLAEERKIVEEEIKAIQKELSPFKT